MYHMCLTVQIKRCYMTATADGKRASRPLDMQTKHLCTHNAMPLQHQHMQSANAERRLLLVAVLLQSVWSGVYAMSTEHIIND